MSAAARLDAYDASFSGKKGANTYSAQSFSSRNKLRLGCGGNTVRFFLILTTSVTFLLGTFLLAGGVFLESKDEQGLSKQHLGAGAAALGATIMFVALTGFCGAKRHSRMLLMIYSVILALFILVQIGVAVLYIITARGKMETWLGDGWEESDNTAKNKIEDQFDCCGGTSVDHDPGTYWPPTECRTKDACIPKLLDTINEWVYLSAGAMLAVSFFQILTMVFTCTLMKSIKAAKAELRAPAYQRL